MSDVKILFKKSCDRALSDDMAYVKQFMIIEKDGERSLTVRMCNGRAERVTRVTLVVTEFDENGGRIRKSKRTLDVDGAPNAVFVPEQAIALDGRTCDCDVVAESARYGAYEYRAQNGGASVAYVGDEAPAPVASGRFADKAGKDGITVRRRKLKAPLSVTLALVIAIVASTLAVYAHMLYFVGTEKTFLHHGVEYAFENGDSSDGTDIYVVGYYGARARVVIPEAIEGHTVKRVQNGAFADNGNLVSVAFKSAIPVGDRAFENCTALKTVEFDNITELGVGAFKGCSMLQSVKIVSDIKEIPSEAFADCTSLAEVSVEMSGVPIKIGKHAFARCTGLKNVDFLRRIDFSDDQRNFFEGAAIGRLHLVEYDTGAADGNNRIAALFGTLDGENVLLEKLSVDHMPTVPESFAEGIASLKSFETLHTDTSEICDRAFSGCYALKDFLYPVAVKKVGERAFCGTAIKAFDGASIESMGDYAFADCGSLELVNLSGNTALTALPVGAFYNCASLSRVTVPVGVTAILPYTFYDCESLASVKYADGGTIEKIGDMAFFGCKALTAFDAPQGLRDIGEYAFAECTGFTEFTVPDETLTVGKGMVNGCIGLKTFTTPFVGESDNSVIGYLGHMFGSKNANAVNFVPESLKKVVVTKTRAIGADAFRSLEYLTEIVLPSSLTTIGASAFYDCKRLTDIDMPLGLRSVGEKAFFGCVGLVELAVPSTVNSIGNGAFTGCDRLQKLSMPYASSRSLGELFGAESYELSGLYVPSSLKNVTIESSSRLPDHAFAYCREIENIDFVDGLTSIGNCAFSECAKLKSLVIPNNTLEIGYGILTGCSALESLTTPFVGAKRYFGDHEYEKSKFELAYFYSPLPANPFNIIYPERALKRVTLTDSEFIAPQAFGYCYYLEQIVLDCDVKTIGNDAFTDCRMLYEVFNYGKLDIAVGKNDNGGIAENALAVHTSRDESALPQAKSGEYRFVSGNVGGNGDWYLIDYPWYDVSYIELPAVAVDNGYTVDEYAIWQYLFYKNYNIESISIPASVTAVGERAFGCCYALKCVAFDARSSVTRLPDSVFCLCEDLYDVRLPDSLTEIGEFAFSGCNRLKRFTVSAAMRSIGDHAFDGCSRLFEIYNMSGLDIVAGYAGYGGISLNARRVYSRADTERDPDIALPNVTVGGVQYIKLGDGGMDWWAVDFYGSSDGVLELKPFDHVQDGVREYVTRIAIFDGAFSAARDVNKLVIGNVIDRIDGDFSSCYSLSQIELANNGGAYDEIEICDNAFTQTFWSPLYFESKIDVSSIGERAFGNCAAAVTVRFDGRVGVIKTDAFASASVGGQLTARFADIGEIRSRAFGATSCTEIKAGNVDSIDVSAFANGDKLTSVEFGNVGSIGDGAFENCAALVRAKFGETGVIGKNAFRACSSLSSVTLSAKDGLSVGAYAFSDCGSLGKFEYAGYITEIGEYAFRNAAALTRVSVGSVDGIGERAFGGCYALDRIVFTGNVGVVGTGAFNNSGVSELRFGGNVGTIESSAFGNCYNLRSVDFGGSLASLGSGAFAECGMLNKIALPSSLAAIPDRAFFGCASLREVALPRELRSLARTAFSGCNGVLVVYDPSTLGASVGACFDEPIAIVGNAADAVVEYRTQNGLEFAEILGKWYHISGWTARNGYIVLPASLNVGGGTVNEVRIAKYITDAGRNVVVGKGITEISPKAFGANTVVYFDGTPAEWREIYKGTSVIKVYYRKDCLHGDGEDHWRTGDDGLPTRFDTVLPETLWQTTVAPTCVKEGEQKATCPHCKKEFLRVAAKLAHDVKDGVCTVCKNSATVLTANNIGSIVGATAINDAKNAFSVGENGRIQSTNKKSDSISIFTVRILRSCDVQFMYGVSSEIGCDKFTIALNGVTLDEISGAVNGLFMRATLKSGDVLTFAYTKDASVSSGDDCGFIDNLTLISTEGAL